MKKNRFVYERNTAISKLKTVRVKKQSSQDTLYIFRVLGIFRTFKKTKNKRENLLNSLINHRKLTTKSGSIWLIKKL